MERLEILYDCPGLFISDIMNLSSIIMELFYSEPTYSQGITRNNLSDRMPAKGLVSKVLGCLKFFKWGKKNSMEFPGNFKRTDRELSKATMEACTELLPCNCDVCKYLQLLMQPFFMEVRFYFLMGFYFFFFGRWAGCWLLL